MQIENPLIRLKFIKLYIALFFLLQLTGCNQKPIKTYKGEYFKTAKSYEIEPNKHFLKIELQHVLALNLVDFSEFMKQGFWNKAKEICGNGNRILNYKTEEIEKIEIIHSHYAPIKYHILLSIQGEIICK